MCPKWKTFLEIQHDNIISYLSWYVFYYLSFKKYKSKNNIVKRQNGTIISVQNISIFDSTEKNLNKIRRIYNKIYEGMTIEFQEWQNQILKLDHPPYSPHLALCDFCFCFFVFSKNEYCNKRMHIFLCFW